MKTTDPKKIVLTGVTSGLGKSLVERFVALGHIVYGCGRNEEALSYLQNRHSHSGSEFVNVDVRDYASVFRWFKGLQAKSEHLPDILINNAGVINKPCSLWEIDQNELDVVVDTNIKGVINVLRAFLPGMVSANQGIVINMSSGWGRSASPEVAPYCATKFAVEGLTLALAQEIPDGMAAIPLNPGIIDTPMLRECFGSAASSYHGPTEWAEKAAPFILKLSPKNNGQSLTVELGKM